MKVKQNQDQIRICVNKAAKIWGNSFTYTLINSDDIV